jgi:GntR family transcriptional regulator
MIGVHQSSRNWCAPPDEEFTLTTTSTASETKRELVRRHLEEQIRQDLEPHRRLPGERDIADELGVNRLTVRRALDELEREGLIYRVQGAGTFVSVPKVSKSFEFASFSEDMRVRNMVPGSLVTEVTLEAAGVNVGYALGVSPSAQVVHLRRVRTADDVPMCLENSYIPHALVPGLEGGMHGESLYETLSHRYGLRPDRADQTILATVLDEASAAQLLVPAFSPAFHVRRTAYDARSRAIEYAESLYRGDRYRYTLSIERSTNGDRQLHD